MGHYFEALPFLGLEFNFSSSDPDVDKAGITVDVSHLSTAGLLVMLRATEKQSKQYLLGLDPYLGLGYGVSLIDVGKVNGTGIGEITGSHTGFAFSPVIMLYFPHVRHSDIRQQAQGGWVHRAPGPGAG